MMLFEAIASGKKFKRPNHQSWKINEGGISHLHIVSLVPFKTWEKSGINYVAYPLGLEDLSSTDWITECDAITITRDEFLTALANARFKAGTDPKPGYTPYLQVIDNLIKELFK